MNYRTKGLWLPVLCALTLSNGLLAIIQIFGPLTHSFWLNPYLSMRPWFTFLIPWLILQPVVGAVAAYWSRRAGGTLRHQLIAALAPSIALLGVLVLVFPFSIMLGEQGTHDIRLNAYLFFTMIWVLKSALPLLLGGAPFVRNPPPLPRLVRFGLFAVARTSRPYLAKNPTTAALFLLTLVAQKGREDSHSSQSPQ